MTNSAKNIDSLELLDKKIFALKTRAKALEKQMDERLDYLQDNYSSMMMKSFIPAIGTKGGVAGSIIHLVLQNRRLQDSFGKLAEQLFNKVSDGVEFIVDKLDKKKNDELKENIED